MSKSELVAAVARSLRLSTIIRDLLGDRAGSASRIRLSIAYLSMSLDHREATLLLIRHGAFMSAISLQRTVLEALVAGIWLNRCASDQQLNQIASYEREIPKFGTMTKNLKETQDFDELIEIFKGHYSTLNDYTHGGRRQLSRWLCPGSVEPNYSHQQMVEVLRYADVLGLIAAFHREELSGRPTEKVAALLNAVLDRSEYPT